MGRDVMKVIFVDTSQFLSCPKIATQGRRLESVIPPEFEMLIKLP